VELNKKVINRFNGLEKRRTMSHTLAII